MSFGCELDQAFGSLTDQEKKLKKKRDKKEKREKRDESGLFTEKQNVDIIFPHELKLFRIVYLILIYRQLPENDGEVSYPQ